MRIFNLLLTLPFKATKQKTRAHVQRYGGQWPKRPSVLLHLVMKWGWYIILWNLGSWHQMPCLIPTVLHTSGADHSLHLVILLQFIKGIWCKEGAVWWKLILKVRAKICDFHWPELARSYPVNWDSCYHALTLWTNKKILSNIEIYNAKIIPQKICINTFSSPCESLVWMCTVW